MDDLRWHNPVYAGDELHVEVEVVDERPSDTWPNVGHVDAAVTTTNGRDQTVLTTVGLGLVQRRDEA